MYPPNWIHWIPSHPPNWKFAYPNWKTSPTCKFSLISNYMFTKCVHIHTYICMDDWCIFQEIVLFMSF